MNHPQRIIAHFDLDSFFVSVEVIHNPELKGKPVIVGGQERGVVSACSYEARKFGIHSAMPVQKARQLCPHAIFLKGNYEAYGNYSRWVTDIIKAEAPLFEKASVDEFYLDLTGMDKFFHPFEWTIALRNSIIEKTGLPISFGLSSNKMMAKIATNLAKPNGYLHIPFGTEKAFLAPLPIGEIPGVGTQTEKLLNSYGIFTIHQAFETGKVELENILGKWGLDLWEKSRGLHFSKVQPYHEAKSISSENTFDENIADVKFLNAELVRLTEKVCFELRQEGKLAGCAAIKVRFPSFETFTRQAVIAPTNSDDAVIPVVKELFKRFYKKNEPVRLLGVKLSNFTSNAIQANLFDKGKPKENLYKAIDDVKKKYGKYSLRRASSNS